MYSYFKINLFLIYKTNLSRKKSANIIANLVYLNEILCINELFELFVQ